MSSNPDRTQEPGASAPPAILDAGAFVRSMLIPLAVWGIMVAVSVIGGEPGVVCITPLAWLLGTVCGVRYATITGRKPYRYPYLAPALAGLLVGMAEGALFILVMNTSMPGYSPSEAINAAVLTTLIVSGGMVICTLSSIFTAWLTWRRLEHR